MERSGKRYSGKPDGGAKRRRNAQRKKTTSQQDYMTTICWDDVVFTEKTFRVVSCGFEDGGFEEFRNLGFRGTEGLEVDFEVTRAHVETSPLWRLLNW